MTERRTYVPRAYQPLITKHVLEHPRCAIWVPMGFGKTCAVLTALDILFICGYPQPALVIGPLRVAKNVWPAEAKKWEHLSQLHVLAITGDEAARRLVLQFPASIYTINPENLEWLVEFYGERWPFRIVVFDESPRLKGFRLKQGTSRSRALASVAHTKIDRFIELSGTPAANGLKDLWGQLWFLDTGTRLGRTYESFKARWFQRSFEDHGIDPLPYANIEIQDKVRDICMSLDAKDYFDLKAPIVNNVYVDLPVKARVQYREMERQMYTEIEANPIEAFNAAARTQKCLQLANGAAYIGSADDPGERKWVTVHDAKLDALESIVEETAGAPLLVSYEFRSDLARILKAFPKARVLDDSQATEDDWNAGRIPMLLAHPKSAGHGLNLQDGGHNIVYFGHNWDLELYAQILERIGPVRQLQSGHERPVFVHHIIARDTVDELVMARRESKRSVQDILLEAVKRRAA